MGWRDLNSNYYNIFYITAQYTLCPTTLIQTTIQYCRLVHISQQNWGPSLTTPGEQASSCVCVCVCAMGWPFSNYYSIFTLFHNIIYVLRRP